MQCKLIDVINKTDDIKDIVKQIDEQLELTDYQLETVRDLLTEYKTILYNFEVKI